MELRTLQTALLAGRSASRWAAQTTILSAPTSSRYFSVSRPLFGEADAPAPAPASSMVDYVNRRNQQQQQGSRTERSIFSPRPSKSPSSNLRDPWTSRSNANLIKPTTQKSSDFIDELGLEDITKPAVSDLIRSRELMGVPRPIDVKMRLRPSVGRTVTVAGNVDVARGLQLLQMKVAANKIRHSTTAQRFYERPGLKKKRLRRQRWRVKFMEGFKATCSRVQDLAKQGW